MVKVVRAAISLTENTDATVDIKMSGASRDVFFRPPAVWPGLCVDPVQRVRRFKKAWASALLENTANRSGKLPRS